MDPNTRPPTRQEHAPTFQEGDLAAVIQSMLRGSGPPEGQHPISLGEPASPPPDPIPAILEPASPVLDEAPGHQDQMETLIHLIMDATGFNRGEIDPDMDVRRDL